MMISTPNMKVDAAISKFKTLDRWTALFAGESGDADLVMEQLGVSLLTVSSRQHINEAMTGAYNKRFGEFSAGRWLACFGMDMNAFRKEGVKTFSPSTYDTLCRQIAEDSANFTLQLMLCGWLPGEFNAQVFSMNRDGFHSHSIDGFAAIGSGAEAATTSLMFQGYASPLKVRRVIGQVCMAKFMAEYCEGVGPITLVSVLSPNIGNSIYLQPYEVEKIREFWIELGMPREPKGMDDLIHEMIKDKFPKATR